MDYIIKNKIFSLGSGSNVRDNGGNDRFFIKGKVFSFSRKKFVRDLNGNTQYIVRNKLFNLLLPKVYICDADNNIVLTIKKRSIFSFRKDFDLLGSDIAIDGDYIGRNYSIYKGNLLIGVVRRNWNVIKDSFLLQTVDDNYASLMIAMVIGLDNFFDRIQKSSN